VKKADSLPFGKISSPEDMGACIRKRRKQQGATQSEFASLCGVGVRFISDLENGKPTIQLGKTLQVLKYLGLELSVQARGWRSRDLAE
jgi:y4mF family transcriptional regulator